MRTYMAGFALVVLLLGGLACSSEERSSQETPEPVTSEKPAKPEKANDGSKEPSAAPAPEERDAARNDAPEDAGTDVSALLAKDAEISQPAAGYAIVTDGVGALSLEVPSGWEHATGEASEIGTANWSNFAGEGLASSITASPDIETWNEVGGLAGTYAVASTALAQAYTDDELVSSGPNDLSASCDPGAISGYERGPYSGLVQAWTNCGGDPAASYVTLSAAPEGRECVVLLHVAMFGEADVQVGQHILDTFEADCGAASSYPLANADEQYTPEQYSEDSEPDPTPQYEEDEEAANEEPPNEVDCSGFTTMFGEPSQWQAQQFYDGVATPEQQAMLDPDGDGFACDDTFSEPGGTPDETEVAEPTPDPNEPDPNAPNPDPNSEPDGPDPYGDWTCEEIGGGPFPVPPGSPHDADGDGLACE